MRLATWNSQKSLEANWAVVEALASDVMTVQECGAGSVERARERDWMAEYAAGKWGRGVIVLARAPFKIEERESSEPFAVSTVISGPSRFRFVGFWAMTPKDAGFSYTRQATRVIESLPDDGLPTVVAGDFNASKSAPHLANVRRLADRGLVSAYHAINAIEHSAVERHPTSYHLWQEGRPFHMDYVFVPTHWTIHAVDIGTYSDYAGPAGLSDHMPVTVTATPE